MTSLSVPSVDPASLVVGATDLSRLESIDLGAGVSAMLPHTRFCLAHESGV